MKQLKSGRLDSSTDFVPTPSRKKNFIFPKSVWDMVQPAIVVRKNNHINSLSSADELKGLNIGYFNSGVITPWFKQNNIQFELLGGKNVLERLLTQLSVERIDAVYWPTLSAIKYDAHKLGFDKQFKYLKSPMGPYPINPMFPKSEAGQKLADDFDDTYKVVIKEYDLPKQKARYLN